MGRLQAKATTLEETPAEAAAAILSALKYLAAEAERASLGELAQAINQTVATAAAELICSHHYKTNKLPQPDHSRVRVTPKPT